MVKRDRYQCMRNPKINKAKNLVKNPRNKESTPTMGVIRGIRVPRTDHCSKINQGKKAALQSAALTRVRWASCTLAMNTAEQAA